MIVHVYVYIYMASGEIPNSVQDMCVEEVGAGKRGENVKVRQR